MIETQQQAIDRLIDWRGNFVVDKIEQVKVKRVFRKESKMFECAANAQTLSLVEPTQYKTISGWLISKEPYEFAEGEYGFLIVSHYWNKYTDGKNIWYIDTTPVDPRISDIDNWAYIKDQSIFIYAKWLDKIGLPNVSVIAPSYVLDKQGRFIETIEVGPGVNTISNNIIVEGSMGHIFRKQMRVDGKFHPIIAKELECEENI